MKRIAVWVLILWPLQLAASGNSQMEAAKLFAERCTLCHGNQGMGEGIMAMKLGGYPDTNLFLNRQYKSRHDLIEVIQNGIVGDKSVRFMPPWKDELSQTEIESLADLIVFLRKDVAKAETILAQAQKDIHVGTSGKLIYETRCVLCHGQNGVGNGRMSKIIKTPPPADLTVSALPQEDLKKIISGGGAAVNRSSQMPPWQDQLTESEIEAVIHYILGLRTLN